MSFQYPTGDFRASKSFADRKAMRRIVDKSGLGHSAAAALKSILNLWFVHRYVAKEIHPGLARLAKAAKVSARTISRILSHFKRQGFISPVQNEKGGNGSTRYTVDMLRIVEVLSPSGVTMISGDLSEADREIAFSRPEPEISDDGLPVLDAVEAADFGTSVEKPTNDPEPFDFQALITNLTLDKMSTGNKGRSKTIEASAEFGGSSRAGASRPESVRDGYGLQAGIPGQNPYLSAKEGVYA